MAVTGAFGAAWQALQDAYYGEWARRLILVEYDVLADEPLRVLAQLYDRLGLPPFAHDPSRVGYEGGAAFDAALNHARGCTRCGRGWSGCTAARCCRRRSCSAWPARCSGATRRRARRRTRAERS